MPPYRGAFAQPPPGLLAFVLALCFPMLLLPVRLGAAETPPPSLHSAQDSVPANRTGEGCYVMPGPTHAVQFRLYTNASPQAAHLFNTFDLTINGQMLLPGPSGDPLRRWLASPVLDVSLHNILVNDAGPRLDLTNSLVEIEHAAGPGWQFVAFDGTAAYADRVKEYRRGLLFVEPDLFVVHDHVVAKAPISFKMLLHPPAATVLDTNWGDLRLNLPGAGFRINAPGRKGNLRFWEKAEPWQDSILPGRVAMRLGPTNKLSEVDVVTVYAVHGGGEQSGYDYYSFKLVESNTAAGARIHRAGLPTLVAFRLDAAGKGASLDGFGFEGPVGLSIFQPKPRPTLSPPKRSTASP